MKTLKIRNKRARPPKKDFDAVEMMRDIRDKIDDDIKDMNFEQEKEYFNKGAEKFNRGIQ